MMLSILLAAITVLPADRLAMADRLFNKGEYAVARSEYAALDGESAIPADELVYRLAECDRALGDKESARAGYTRLISEFPASKHADRSILMKALAGTVEERRSELRMLDSDRVAADIRSAALYYLGSADNDPALLAKCIEVDPKGRYASYANFHRASILVKSPDAAERRKAVELLLTIAFSGDAKFAEEALYLAAVQSYAERKYGEAASLFRRYLKNHPSGAHANDVRVMAAWSDYLSGKYTDCAAICGDVDSDDFTYLRAACVYAVGERERAGEMFAGYLERYPNGRYRNDAELSLSRIGFNDAEKADDNARIIENAKRAYSLSGLSGDELRLAWAYEKCGMNDEAEAEYGAVARNFAGTDDAAEALFRKAMMNARLRRWQTVELSLAEALASGANQKRKAESLYWRGVAACQLDHEAEGVGFLSEALALGLSLDEQREAKLIIADVDMKNGAVDRAKAAYAALVREGGADRMSASKLLSVGKMLEADEARVCANRLVAGDSAPWRQAGFALLGAIGEREGAFSVAIDCYRKAMAEDAVTADLPAAALALGVLEYRNGEYEAAERTLKRAVELNTESSEARQRAYLALAQTCEAKGDHHSAVGYATVVTTLFAESDMTREAQAIIDAPAKESK